jgi:hypothetical protein
MRSGRMPVRWILVSVVIVALLDQNLEPTTGPSGPAAALYLWTYGSSVLAHLAFFDLPGSAVLGGLLMGLLALPFAARLWRSRPAARPRRPQHSLSDQR